MTSDTLVGLRNQFAAQMDDLTKKIAAVDLILDALPPEVTNGHTNGNGHTKLTRRQRMLAMMRKDAAKVWTARTVAKGLGQPRKRHSIGVDLSILARRGDLSRTGPGEYSANGHG